MPAKKAVAQSARKAAEPSAKEKKAAAVDVAKKSVTASATPSSPTQVNMYAIPSCDTIRKARAWLDSKKIPYTFHDYTVRRSAGHTSPINAERVQGWMDAIGWDKVFNMNSTTYRQMSPAAKAKITDAKTAIPLLLEKPTMIKRPVVEWGKVGEGKITVGFNAEEWAAVIKK